MIRQGLKNGKESVKAKSTKEYKSCCHGNSSKHAWLEDFLEQGGVEPESKAKMDKHSYCIECSADGKQC